MHEVQPALLRPLTPDDRTAVAELLRRLDPEDWLLEELDLWLTGPGPDGVRGYGGYGWQLPAGRLAGICLLDYNRPGEAYLGGVRTAPGLQNQGHATRMVRAVLQEAVKQGARRAWLTSRVDNLPMHRVAEKLGFARVGRWQVWEAPVLTLPSAGYPPVRPAALQDRKRLADWLERHPLSGEESVTSPDSTVWDVTPVTLEDFQAWLEAGQLMLAEAGEIVGVMACHWAKKGTPHLRIRYLRGTARAVHGLLAWAEAECRRQPAGRLGLGLPGLQADLVRPCVASAREDWPGFAFMQRLKGDLGESSP